MTPRRKDAEFIKIVNGQFFGFLIFIYHPLRPASTRDGRERRGVKRYLIRFIIKEIQE
jgi:hypothetical protein